MKTLFSLVVIFLTWTGVTIADDIFLYDSHGKRDPFVPLLGPGVRYISSGLEVEETPSEAGNEGFVLSGIIWDPEGECLAVINGEVCKKDDELGDCRIAEVKEDRVLILDKKGELRILIMYADVENESNLQEGDEDVQNKE